MKETLVPVDHVIRLDGLDGPSEEFVAREWRVLVVDDYPLMRQVVRLACESAPNLRVVAETGNGLEALEKCAELSPDVIVLDVDIDGINGIEVARRLRAAKVPIRILMLTGSDEPNVTLDAMRLQVDGYIDKMTAFETLAHVIETVAAGKRVVSASADRRAAREFGSFVRQSRARSRVQGVLTERELDVLEMISMALTTTQMAHRLGLSERTIETHITKLYKKLEVGTRTAAVRKGSSLGLIGKPTELAHA